MNDTIDDVARESAQALLTEVAAVDTEAALVRLRVDARSPRSRWAAAGGRRPLVAGAVAALVVVAVVGVALVVVRSEDDTVGVAAAEPGPADFGSVVATLTGAEDPDLRAELHGPAEAVDGTTMAVSISGGQPGQPYNISQCLQADGPVNPASMCRGAGELVLDDRGAGWIPVRAWLVFDGQSVFRRNDCRLDRCGFEVYEVMDEDRPGSGGSETAFERDGGGAPSMVVTFGEDAEAPPLPDLELTEVGRTDDSVVVRLSGRNARPGRTPVVVQAYEQPVEPFPAMQSTVGSATESSVEVAPDGTFDAEVSLPVEIEEDGTQSVNGVVVPRAPVRCDLEPERCTVFLAIPERRSGGLPDGDERILRPEPVGYPGS
jgi:hypothetical protein